MAMNVRTLCLAILSCGDATGYEIRKESVEGKYSHFVDASFGSIYPALSRLEKEGLVVWREETQPGKPARKIYSITDAGRQEFAKALMEPPSPDMFRSEFLLIAMFADVVGREGIARAIDVRINQISDERDHLAQLHAKSESDSLRWVTQYGIDCMGRSIEHLQANRSALEQIAEGQSVASIPAKVISFDSDATSPTAREAAE